MVSHEMDKNAYMRETLAQRIKRLRTAKEASQQELADFVGVSRVAVTNWESGDTKNIRPDNLVKLALFFNISVEELITGHEVARQENTEQAPRMQSTLPLISWVMAGRRSDANDPYSPGAAEEWIEFESAASSSAYCLRVRGDSMVRPDGSGFPEGCIIAVEPKRLAKPGDFVIMRFNDTDETTFKQYMKDGPVKLLKPLNPHYPTMQFAPDAAVVGVVYEMRISKKY